MLLGCVEKCVSGGDKTEESTCFSPRGHAPRPGAKSSSVRQLRLEIAGERIQQHARKVEGVCTAGCAGVAQIEAELRDPLLVVENHGLEAHGMHP